MLSDSDWEYFQIVSENTFRFCPKICSDFVREFVLFLNWNTYSPPHSQINRLGFVISKFGFSEHMFLDGLIFNLGPIFVPYTTGPSFSRNVSTVQNIMSFYYQYQFRITYDHICFDFILVVSFQLINLHSPFQDHMFWFIPY